MDAASARKIDQDTIEVTVRVRVSDSLLETEEKLQDGLNAAGRAALELAVPEFDADGSPIRAGKIRYTSKGRFNQAYESPYGTIHVERHVYQSQYGGKTYCPLEEKCRMILNATPRLAKIVSAKYVEMGAPALVRDMEESLRRSLSVRYVKSLGDFVGAVAEAKEAHWEYDIPGLPEEVASVAVGLDGTCMLMKEDGWRQAMCGSISLYDRSGERMHTIYAGAAPEYGKAAFHERFDRELERVKSLFPGALYLGLADGAPDNWSWLEPRTERQLIDFWHAREYVGKAAQAIWGKREKEREAWETDWSHRLKHERGVVPKLLLELREAKKNVKKAVLEDLSAAERYFANQKEKMEYWRHQSENLPIGSGVTEAACKTLIKARLCQSGMRWKSKGAACVIALRALRRSDGRWEQFWNKINKYGI
jgi:hypothetical protein